MSTGAKERKQELSSGNIGDKSVSSLLVKVRLGVTQQRASSEGKLKKQVRLEKGGSAMGDKIRPSAKEKGVTFAHLQRARRTGFLLERRTD